jgi:hypothetical protein
MEGIAVMMKKILFSLFTVLLVTQMITQTFGAKPFGKWEVVGVINPRNFGEQGPVRGVCAALSQKVPYIQVREISADELKQLEEACQTENKIIFITAGVDGAKAVHRLAAQNYPQVTYIHTSHMILPEHAALLTEVQFLALPKHATSEEFLKKARTQTVKLIQTVGVPHNVTKEIMKKAYEKNTDAFSWVSSRPKVAMLILGGDAPTPNGEMRFYTAEDARKTAQYVGNLCKTEGRSLMVFNGPRTGQHDQSDPAHKKLDWGHTDERFDPITQIFADEITKILPPTQVRIYHFVPGSASYKGALWVLKNAQDAVCFLPGESTSMISEINDALPGKTKIIENSAMNEVHAAHVKSEIEAGRSQGLDKNFAPLPYQIQSMATSNNQPAAQQIAQVVIDDLELQEP